MYYYGRDKRRRFKKRLKVALTALAVIGITALCYFLLFSSNDINPGDQVDASLSSFKDLPDTVPTLEKKGNIQTGIPGLSIDTNDTEKTVFTQKKSNKEVFLKNRANTKSTDSVKAKERPSPLTYKIISVAFFHDQPDEQTRRKAFVNHWNNSYASIKPLDEKNGFIYVVFTNHLGTTSKGWLRKKDLREVSSLP